MSVLISKLIGRIAIYVHNVKGIVQLYSISFINNNIYLTFQCIYIY